ncbi:hypothetical protein O6H91_21G054500 [Diphasiastrum complanatum]|uniref:Uncharacterized protein n=1 Tax=Diphasiastrum complanatum TaxID=34168 RepID=A0ACC2AKL8_DIPCM|nr:hypothetical protein O6H91_21G054500 [Diphasiastrum complanatum]
MDASDDVDHQKLVGFEKMTQNPAEMQAQVLADILRLNAGVEYLARCGFSSSSSSDSDVVASFKAHVPVVSYEAIEDDLQRIADGDRGPILTAQPVISLTLSSGTTAGRPKMLPSTEKSRQIIHSSFQLSSIFRKRFFPTKAFPTVLSFVYAGKQFETKSGLKLGSGSTNFFRSEAFKKSRRFTYTSPDEIILGYDVRESMYCHLVCGLIRRDNVEFISSTFAFGLIEALRMLEEAWQEICADIRNGVLSTRIKDAELRSSVQSFLNPANPELAEIIEKECRAQSWAGILERLWPTAKFVFTVVTGAMLPYAPALRDYAGNLPIVGIDYVASEGFIGYNSDANASAEDISFIVGPNLAYFEFIPLQKNDQNVDLFESLTTANYIEDDPVGLAEVRLGGLYEIVLTTFSGLYRYRLGDIVKVTGFHNATPQIAVYGRKNSILSVNTDKTDEQELRQVVTKAAMVLKEVDMKLTHFTSSADRSSRPGHYALFWELQESKDNVPSDVLQRCSSILDTSFNNPYMRGRAAETIGPLELCIVRKDTFGLMRDYALSRGAAADQYKTPSCITSPELLSILRKGVVQTCFSPKFPEPVLASWKPEMASS